MKRGPKIALIIVGGYMLLVAISGMSFGTFVDRHLRRTSMLLSSGLSLGGFALGALVYFVSPGSALRDLGHPAFWALVIVVLAGAVACLRLPRVTVAEPVETLDEAARLLPGP